jgi:hypothetical protein
MTSNANTIDFNDESENKADSFEYPKSSMAYKNQKKKENNANVRILKRGEHTMTAIPIDPQSISVLIGVKGRNISLISKHASVFAAVEKNSQVAFVSKSERSDHDLAHRLMISMVSGGVLRWFNHPAATNKYYHTTAREALEQFVSENSDCVLDILRAYNGHLCLLLIPKKDADKEKVVEQIKTLRPQVLERINSYAYDPATSDPNYNSSSML